MRSNSRIALDLVRPAGFEPATRCLEGSRSIRLSYWRSMTIVHAEDHASATLRSQSARGAIRPIYRTSPDLVGLEDYRLVIFRAQAEESVFIDRK